MRHESAASFAASSNPRAAEICSKKIGRSRRRKFFRVVAKFVFPRQTAFELEQLTGYPERTIYEWLGCRSDAPFVVMLQLFGKAVEH